MATLKSLVDETTNIKNELVECRDTLKQILIDKSKDLDTEFEKIVDELKLVYDVERLEDIDICKVQVEKIQIVVSAIMSKVRLIRQLELDNSTLLRDMKDNMEKKIKAIKVGKKAVANYGYGKIQQPVYFDKNH